MGSKSNGGRGHRRALKLAKDVKKNFIELRGIDVQIKKKKQTDQLHECGTIRNDANI